MSSNTKCLVTTLDTFFLRRFLLTYSQMLHNPPSSPYPSCEPIRHLPNTPRSPESNGPGITTSQKPLVLSTLTPTRPKRHNSLTLTLTPTLQPQWRTIHARCNVMSTLAVSSQPNHNVKTKEIRNTHKHRHVHVSNRKLTFITVP